MSMFTKVLVDTEDALADLLNDIIHLLKGKANLFVDLEGVNLFRMGTIAIIHSVSSTWPT